MREKLIKDGHVSSEGNEDPHHKDLLSEHIGTLMMGFDNFQRAWRSRKAEAELRIPVDNLLQLVWHLSDLKRTRYM